MNEVHCYVIFSLKIISITLCILNGYAGIAHFHENPVFGVMHYVLAFDLLLLYSIIYDRAFMIPFRIGEAVKSMSVGMLPKMSRGQGAGRELLERQLRSIPRAGIRVGSFHTLERISTPVFIDYIIKNIVNMLVAYR